jgi:hypothetical protein
VRFGEFERGWRQSETFNWALMSALSEGWRIPCGESDSWMWTSDFKHDRERAADECLSCPVMVLCGVAAEARGEDHFVWGGVDRDRRSLRGGDRKSQAYLAARAS